MPKIVEYPRASFASAIELASAVYDLGGRSSIQTCADKMKKKVGGSFKAIVSSADKFGLIYNQRGELSCTELFTEYQHAYSEEEEITLLKNAFLTSGVFLSLYERFKGRTVPAEILDRILVREFDIPPQVAPRISGYFITGAKQVGLLDDGNKLVDAEIGRPDLGEESVKREAGKAETATSVSDEIAELLPSNPDLYSILFQGPGLNTRIEIESEDDLLIVEAIIKKIKKRFEEPGESLWEVRKPLNSKLAVFRGK